MPRRVNARTSPEATVRISGIQSIPGVLESLGANPARIFAAEKVDPALFDDAENAISLAVVGRLVHRCVEVTGCQHFGLLVGQQGGLRSFGLVGLMARYSPDVQTALSRLSAYIHLYYGGQVVRLDATARRGDAQLLHLPARHQGRRPDRGWRARHLLQRHAQSLRRRLAPARSPIRPPQTGQYQALRPGIPDFAAVRCGTERRWCSRRTGCGVACPKPTPTCSACSRSRSSRSRPATATNSRSRCAACFAPGS